MTVVVTEAWRNSAASFSARAWVRLETRMLVAPCWMRWRAASSDMLPCSDEQDGLALQAAEDLAGEVYGHGGDGDAA